MNNEKQYGSPTCMICGEVCDIVEILNYGRDDEEGWCYCKKCKVDTFHPPLTEQEISELENNKNK